MFLNRLFDIVSFTPGAVACYVYIVLISLVSAVIFLLIFKKTSNQQKITYHKDNVLGHVLQIPLYRYPKSVVSRVRYVPIRDNLTTL